MIRGTLHSAYDSYIVSVITTIMIIQSKLSTVVFYVKQVSLE